MKCPNCHDTHLRRVTQCLGNPGPTRYYECTNCGWIGIPDAAPAPDPVLL